MLGVLTGLITVVLSLGIAFWAIYWDHQKKRLQYQERQLMIEKGMTPPPVLPDQPTKKITPRGLPASGHRAAVPRSRARRSGIGRDQRSAREDAEFGGVLRRQPAPSSASSASGISFTTSSPARIRPATPARTPCNRRSLEPASPLFHFYFPLSTFPLFTCTMPANVSRLAFSRGSSHRHRRQLLLAAECGCAGARLRLDRRRLLRRDVAERRRRRVSRSSCF